MPNLLWNVLDKPAQLLTLYLQFSWDQANGLRVCIACMRVFLCTCVCGVYVCVHSCVRVHACVSRCCSQTLVK